MWPSEASALTWGDVDLEQRTISISKSRYMGSESAPKTSGSARVIQFVERVADVLKILPSRELGIRHRKFYATRHTFISEAIRRGENPLAAAQYCGMSLAMIQGDYCGRWACGSITIEPKSNRRPKIPCKIWLRGRDLNPPPEVLPNAFKSFLLGNSRN